MKNPCDDCMYSPTCWARKALEDLVVGFKYLAATEGEKQNCNTTHTAHDMATAMGGACTMRKQHDNQN